jgi:hypothetical protein
MSTTPRTEDGAQPTEQSAARTREHAPAPLRREQMPTRDYAALTAIFNGAIIAALLARKCSRDPLPERTDPQDLVLYALATQKLSRVITKGKVTTALRAPFTEIEGKGGAGELEERARGRGLQRAIGELLTCPFCIGTWIASGFIYGSLFGPRPTRAVASIFAVAGVADFLQHLYVKSQEMNDQI